MLVLIGPLEDFGEEEVRRQFEVNVFGAVRVIWGALGYLRERGGGCVVNVSSVAGLDALPGAALYSGSKFALEGRWWYSFSFLLLPVSQLSVVAETDLGFRLLLFL